MQKPQQAPSASAVRPARVTRPHVASPFSGAAAMRLAPHSVSIRVIGDGGRNGQRYRQFGNDVSNINNLWCRLRAENDEDGRYSYAIAP